MKSIRNMAMAAAVFPILLVMAVPAGAEGIFGAMAKAYENNPDLNAARAGLRATDEGVTIAKSGYRPRVNAVATMSATSTETPRASISSRDASVGFSLTQTLFDGFQTRNNVRAAKADVFATREQLRATETQILLAAAQAYANYARDIQIVGFRRENIRFLQEQLNAARARFDVGEGTRTDVSQADAQLAAAQALLTSAIAQQKSSAAVYVQIVGTAPTGIKVPSPITGPLPSTLEAALAIGQSENPNIRAALFSVDAADYQVKSAEGAFLPGVSLEGTVSHLDGGTSSADITARLSVPLYQGGAASGRVRQRKELLGQARILVDSARRTVEQSIVTAWTLFDAANATIQANQAQIRAANVALNGVVEERNVGQRTTLDVLNGQQAVLNARESLAQSQRNAVVASYQILAFMGRLTVPQLNLKVAEYRPEEHYEAVKDKWYGLRTVDGR